MYHTNTHGEIGDTIICRIAIEVEVEVLCVSTCGVEPGSLRSHAQDSEPDAMIERHLPCRTMSRVNNAPPLAFA